MKEKILNFIADNILFFLAISAGILYPLINKLLGLN